MTRSLRCRSASVAHSRVHSRDTLDGIATMRHPAFVRVRGTRAIAEHRNGCIGLADRSACPLGDRVPHLIVRLLGSVEVASGDHSSRAYRSEKTVTLLARVRLEADRPHCRMRTLTRTGHRAEALAQYGRPRATLSEPWGPEPSRRATRLRVAYRSPRNSPCNGEPGGRAAVHRGSPARKMFRPCRT